MRSTPEVSSTEVMFSDQEGSVWPMLPPRAFSVGFEEKNVVGVMFFYVFRPQNCGKIVISDFVQYRTVKAVYFCATPPQRLLYTPG